LVIDFVRNDLKEFFKGRDGEYTGHDLLAAWERDNDA